MGVITSRVSVCVFLRELRKWEPEREYTKFCVRKSKNMNENTFEACEEYIIYAGRHVGINKL